MIIFRYLCKEVLATLLATTLILLIIFITNQFVHYLHDAAEGKITIQAVMMVMSLQVPIFLGYLLPLGLFLGLLLTLGRMNVDHEMVVLSACGVSRTQLVAMVMALATMLMLIVAWLMLSVEPKMQWYQGKIFTEAVTRASLSKVVPGRFQPLGKGKVFYAADVAEDHHDMENVFLAQQQKANNGVRRWDVVSADHAGEISIPRDGRFLVFNNGMRYIGTPGQRNFDVAQFSQYGLRLDAPNADISGRIEAMPTSHLWHLRKHNLKAVAELEWRIAMPLSLAVFALLAIPLSHVNPRRGKFARMFPAILLYIMYANLMFMGRAWVEKGVIGPHLGLWWIHATFLSLALLLLFLQSRWRFL